MPRLGGGMEIFMKFKLKAIYKDNYTFMQKQHMSVDDKYRLVCLLRFEMISCLMYILFQLQPSKSQMGEKVYEQREEYKSFNGLMGRETQK